MRHVDNELNMINQEIGFSSFDTVNNNPISSVSSLTGQTAQTKF